MFLKLNSLFAIICIAVTTVTGGIIEDSDPALIAAIKAIADNAQITSLTVVEKDGQIVLGFPTIELTTKLADLIKITEAANVLVLSDSYTGSVDALAKVKKAFEVHGNTPLLIILTKATIKETDVAVGGAVSTIVKNKCVLNSPIGTINQGPGLINLVLGILNILGLLSTLCGLVEAEVANDTLNNFSVLG